MCVVGRRQVSGAYQMFVKKSVWYDGEMSLL